MKRYTGFEYLCIDAANQFGHDKLLFEQRIQWVMDHFDELEELECKEKTAPQYYKAVQAIREAQKGIPSGHLVGLDACCSGMQIMSALGGCIDGARATNLVNTGFRQDAYSLVTTAASTAMGASVGDIKRSDIKKATMTHLYGSKAEPKKLFGEETPELEAFYEGIQAVCPIPNEMLSDLIHSHQAYQEVHEWVLPDNYHARVKSVSMKETRIEVDEMDGATFEYAYKVVCGEERSVKNAANIIHSIDAYVLRSMHRRCNYDPVVTEFAYETISDELMRRVVLYDVDLVETKDEKVRIYIDLYNRTNMVDAVILPFVNTHSVQAMETDHLEALKDLCVSMLAHKPFPLVTVHDEFKCHPNYCNEMRQHYINIFSEMADSNILNDIFHQITGSYVQYEGACHNLSELIRDSEYALS